MRFSKFPLKIFFKSKVFQKKCMHTLAAEKSILCRLNPLEWMMAVRPNFEEWKFILQCYWKYKKNAAEVQRQEVVHLPTTSFPQRLSWVERFQTSFFLCGASCRCLRSSGTLQLDTSRLVTRICCSFWNSPPNLSLQLHFHTSTCILEWISILQGLQ